jgi:hypothetical protein
LALSALSCSEAVPVADLTITPSLIRVSHGSATRLKLGWKMAAPLDRRHGDPFVFVHVLKRRGHVLRDFDHRFPVAWRPGSEHAYEIDLALSALSPPLPPGRYQVTVGLHDSSWGYRWPLVAGVRAIETREYLVATLEVPSAAPGDARFSFSTTLVPEDGHEGARLVTGPASIVVRGPEGPGDVRLGIVVATDETVEAQRSVRIRSECGNGSEMTVKEEQEGVLHLPILLGAEPCTIELVPEGPPAGTIRLHEVAWRPRPAS